MNLGAAWFMCCDFVHVSFCNLSISIVGASEEVGNPSDKEQRIIHDWVTYTCSFPL